MALTGNLTYDKFGTVTLSRFSTGNGSDEIFLHVNAESGLSNFNEIIKKLEIEYNNALQQFELRDEQLIFSRIFFSDIINQKDAFSKSLLFQRLQNGAMSVIQQPPLLNSPIQLFAYFITNADAVKKNVILNSNGWSNRIIYRGNHYTLIYNANYAGQDPGNSEKQTKEIFESYVSELADQNMKLCDNTIRTWIFVRDIFNNYSGMVKARRELFTREGLNETTRYVASTGIGGSSMNTDSLVSVDALAFGNLKPNQVQRMDSNTHMPRTINYGVTFERGLRVTFGDRSHLYISGTASIDQKGEVLHSGNIVSQTERTIENIDSLLIKQGASLKDMAYLIVYVHDHRFAQYAVDIIKNYFSPEVPCVIVQASICRPSWLIELEGFALINKSDSFPPFI